MRKMILCLAIVLLCIGCSESSEQASRPAGAPAVITEPQTVLPAVETESQPAEPTTTVKDSSDAAQILAASLETAKSEDKRVLIHLGAPG